MNEGRLDRLLRPRSIAFYGGEAAAAAIDRCSSLGFAGDIWPVDRALSQMLGHPVFASTSALPGAPDAAFVAVDGSDGDAIVAELSARGAGGVVRRRGGGMSTSAPGLPLLNDGFLSALDGIDLVGVPAEVRRIERGVAFVAQSAALVHIVASQKRGLPLALAGSTSGHLAEFGAALTRDDRITAIGLAIDAVQDVAGFEGLAIRARRTGIPLVAVATGNDESALLFARLGVAEVGSLGELLETLKLLHVHGVLAGRSVAAIAASAGEARLVGAAAGRAGVLLPAFPEVSAEVLKARLGSDAPLANPLVIPPDVLADRDAFSAVVADVLSSGADLAMLLAAPPRDGLREETVHAFRMAVAATDGKAAIMLALPESLAEDLAIDLADTGMVPLAGLDDAFAAVRAAAFVGEAFARDEPMALARPGPVPGGIRVFSEAEGKYLLKRIGVTVPDGSTVGDATSAVWAAEAIGYPLVVKAVGVGEDAVGAISLSLSNPEELSAAITRMLALSPELLVERMVEETSAELFVSIRRLPAFAFQLTLRLGGAYPELVGDSASLLLPTTEGDIRAALLSLKLAPILGGHDHALAADVDAAVAIIDRLASFSVANEETMLELTVDPLMLRAPGKGAVAAGVLIRMAE